MKPQIDIAKDKLPCWLVWHIKQGTPYLVSVDMTEALAKTHAKMVKHEIDERERVGERVHNERREVNHLYGAQGL